MMQQTMLRIAADHPQTLGRSGECRLTEIFVGLLVGVLASIIAALLFPSIQDGLQRLWVRAVGRILPKRSFKLTGSWKSTWHVRSPKYPAQVVDDDATIKQVGQRIYGVFKAGQFECYLVGRVQERMVTGIWHDEINGGYHGAFQFILDPSTGNLSGKWIGFSRGGTVKEGNWTWERVG